jgi:hypothetical protein
VVGLEGVVIEAETVERHSALGVVPAVGEQDAADVEEDCIEGVDGASWAPAVRPTARYPLALGSWVPRSPNARDLGHPGFEKFHRFY